MFRNYGFACGLCGSKKQIQVHHRTYKNQYNEKPEDLIVLCHTCHEYLTFKENYRRSNIEAEEIIENKLREIWELDEILNTKSELSWIK